MSKADQLAERTFLFGVRALKFVRTLPRDPAATELARQLGRAGPGVGANFRSARRGRSRAEFIARLAVAFDEADESQYWSSMAQATDLAAGAEIEWLIAESRELRSILSAAVATA